MKRLGRPPGKPEPRNEQERLIKAAAAAAGLSVVALARAIDTPASTVRQWQSEESRMPGVAATLLRLIAEGAISREQVAR